ncbi:AAA family ATPase [Rhizobium leguminosarum]|uniref:AAA family ATPase n=1 Tax=Rhizobium leguminosarum TaxID=384 RepID=UPI00160EDD15|nr:AAA family ATPase [Rhizobium leguminosarum]MBB4326966.1 hypothetical protein [Rhizobium leguminosarum]MBB4352631.1 hypothetical protein [Rhizobium leguminosarum]MBB4547280.1 hypothetical protein [Rhizobium leguminosarum]MBB4559732.1 hypothetical protein [Rhizobium leguminosarum]
MKTADDVEREAERIEPEPAPKAGGEANHDYRPKSDARQVKGPDLQLLSYREYRKRAGVSSGANSIVEGLIRAGTLIAIGGRPGWGKTALLVELSRLLTRGEPFLGRRTVPCAVVYFAVEDQDDVANRLEALEEDGVFLVQSDELLRLTNPKRTKEIVLSAITQARDKRPGVPIFVVVDTLRAGLGGQSVLDDRYTSPALNALRELAEAENAVVAVANHTNRENPKATKGESLEAVAALELLLLQSEGDSFAVHVGKNRSGPAYRQIGRMRLASINVRGVGATVVDALEIDGDAKARASDEARPQGANQRLIIRIMQQMVHDAPWHLPFGAEGPRVRTIKEADLRTQFLQQKTGDDRETKARGFRAALEALADKETVVRRENMQGEGILWFREKEAEAKGVLAGFPVGD